MNRYFYAFLLAFTFSATPTMAQENSAREIEEVVITALRKETNLQDTAITITAITGADLEAKQIENFEDLQFAVPTLGFQKGAYSGSGITLRGIGNFAVGNSTSNSIGYFWNGQTASASGLYEQEFFDVERVEVLRGPQGSLFGAGTTGGLIQMITKRPDAEAGGYLKADVADYDSLRLEGAVNLPLTDRLRSRFAFASLQREGFVTNSHTGNKLDDRNTQGARMSFEFDYSDDTTMTLVYETTKADDNRLRAARQFCKQDKFYGCSPFENGNDAVWSPGSYGHWVPYLQYQNTSLDYTIYENNPSSDLRSVNLDFEPTHEAVLQNTVFEINSALSDTMNMVFTYSYHTREYEDFADYDHSVSVVPYAMGPITSNIFYDPSKGNMAGAALGMRTYTSDQAMDRSFNESEWQQYELRFSSDYDGAFNFTFGLFSSSADSETDYNIGTPYMNYWGDVSTGPIGAIFPDAAPYGGAPFWVGWFQTLPVASAQATQLVLAGLLPPAQAQGFVLNTAKNGGKAAADASIGPRHLAEWQQYFHVDSNLNRSSEAIYGEMYFDLSDLTTLTIGGRYTEFEINDRAFNSLLDLQNQGAGYYGSVKPAPIPRSYAAEESTYKLGLDHQLNDNQLLYATYSTGFKPGGFNTTIIEGLETFDSEVANVFEIGLKSTLMEGALQLNISAYTNDYEGLQLSQIVNRASINQNGDAKIDGIEAEFTLLLSDTLVLDGFVSKTSTEIENFKSVDPLNPNQATTKLPLPAGATGFFSDFAPLIATCNPLVFVGQAAPSNECYLGIAAQNPLLGALVLYTPTDAGYMFKSFGPLCTVPFFGLDSTTLPCPLTDGVEADLSGNSLPMAAELNYRLGVTKFVDTASGSWSFRMDYSYRDDYYSTAFNRPRGHIEDVSLIDLSMKYTPVSEAWFVGAYVRNMGDEDHIYAYYSTDVTVGGFQNGVAIDPKIFGINFGMNF